MQNVSGLVLYLAQPHEGKQTTAPKHATKNAPKSGTHRTKPPDTGTTHPPSPNPSEKRLWGPPPGRSIVRTSKVHECRHTHTHTHGHQRWKTLQHLGHKKALQSSGGGRGTSLLRQGPQGLQVGREEQHQGTCGRERKPGPDPGHDEGSVGARTRGRSFAFGWRPLLYCDGAELFSFRHDLRRGVILG